MVHSTSDVKFDLVDPPAALLEASPVRKVRSDESYAAFMVAGITGYARCEQERIETYHVNVTSTITLAAELVKSGGFVVYPSSTAVFGVNTGRCDESALPSPNSEYGRQKANAEQGMLRLIEHASAPAGVAVVRLTKVIGGRGMVGGWIETLRKGGLIEAATDVLFSPISSAFAAHGLIEIAAMRRSGVYHLSGEGVMSYFEFALRLADVLGAGRSRVRPVEIGGQNSAGAGSAVALEMSETRKYVAVSPQTIDAVLLDLIASR
jgi:dTDP-4-dehydrorhamnose reductase